MSIENLNTILKSQIGDELVAYFKSKIEELEKEEGTRLEKILSEPNNPVEELVALKVIARTKEKVKKILDEIILFKDYVKAEPEKNDESFNE